MHAYYYSLRMYPAGTDSMRSPVGGIWERTKKKVVYHYVELERVS
jgi:hypothetical protein